MEEKENIIIVNNYISCCKKEYFTGQVKVTKNCHLLEHDMHSHRLNKIKVKVQFDEDFTGFKFSLFNVKLYYISMCFYFCIQDKISKNIIFEKNTEINNKNEENIIENFSFNKIKVFFPKNTLKIIFEIEVYEKQSHIINGKYYAGLINQGSTCYINALIQVLFNIPCLKNEIFNLESENKTIKELQNLFFKLSNEKHPVSTVGLTDSFGWNNHQLDVQQDVHELNILLSEILGTKWKIFEGEIENTVKCMNIDYQSKIKETINDISLTISNYKNIYESLDHYISQEELIGNNKYDAFEHGKQDAIRFVRINKLPDIFFIQFKRIEYSIEKKRLVTVNNNFEYYNEINLEKYLSEDSLDKNNSTYNLFSVIVHDGNANSGHYYSYVLNQKESNKNRWILFNDDYIKQANDYEVLNLNFMKKIIGYKLNKNTYTKIEFIPSFGAYLLVYVKKSKYNSIFKETQLNELNMIKIKENSKFRLLITKSNETQMLLSIYFSFEISHNAKKYILSGILDEMTFIDIAQPLIKILTINDSNKYFFSIFLIDFDINGNIVTCNNIKNLENVKYSSIYCELSHPLLYIHTNVNPLLKLDYLKSITSFNSSNFCYVNYFNNNEINIDYEIFQKLNEIKYKRIVNTKLIVSNNKLDQVVNKSKYKKLKDFFKIETFSFIKIETEEKVKEKKFYYCNNLDLIISDEENNLNEGFIKELNKKFDLYIYNCQTFNSLNFWSAYKSFLVIKYNSNVDFSDIIYCDVYIEMNNEKYTLTDINFYNSEGNIIKQIDVLVVVPIYSELKFISNELKSLNSENFQFENSYSFTVIDKSNAIIYNTLLSSSNFCLDELSKLVKNNFYLRFGPIITYNYSDFNENFFVTFKSKEVILPIVFNFSRTESINNVVSILEEFVKLNTLKTNINIFIIKYIKNGYELVDKLDKNQNDCISEIFFKNQLTKAKNILVEIIN